MGCGASKDATTAAVDSSNNNGTNHRPTTTSTTKPTKTQNGGSSSNKGHANGNGNGNGNDLSLQSEWAPLNDHRTVGTQRTDGTMTTTTDGETRNRFYSYASGSSTPYTSDDEEQQQLESSPTKKGFNPKILKPSNSSSIGLDEIAKADGAGLSTKVVHMEVPFGKPIEEFYNGVHDGPVLGSGAIGLVRLAEHKSTGIKYAVKCIDLGMLDGKEGLERLREEVFIMCQLDHPNIVRLEEVYESHSEIYLVQELCTGGQLFDRLDEQPVRSLSQFRVG